MRQAHECHRDRTASTTPAARQIAGHFITAGAILRMAV